MITKEERERDKAIREAATPGPWAPGMNRVHTDRENIADTEVSPLGTSTERARANAEFIAAARNRLPLYIDALDKIDERMATIEELTRGDDSAESKAAAMVLRILRGET